MLKRVINLVAVLTLLISFPGSSRGKAGPLPPTLTIGANIPTGIHLLHSDSSGVVLELDVPLYELVNEYQNGERIQKIILDGAGNTAEVGKPEMPVFSALIGLPAYTKATLQVVSSEMESPSGYYNFSPVPRADSLQPGSKTGDYIYERDSATYSEDALYPSFPGKIVDDAWLRDQRVIRVELYPFQYNPLQGSLLWNRQLTVRVKFDGDTTTRIPGGTDNNKVDAFDTILEELVLNYDVARAWRGVPPVEIYAPDLTTQDPAATDYDPVFLGPRYKIVVDHDGLYRLTYEALQQTQPLENNDPNTFHMYNQGRDVAIHMEDGGDGEFGAGDRIYFYGEEFRGDYMAQRYAAESSNWLTFTQQLSDGSLALWHPDFDHFMLEKYTDQNVYWLTVGGTGGPRMSEVNGDPSGSTLAIPSTYQATIHAERELRHWESSFTTTDSWYWDYATDSSTHIYTTTITGVATGVFTATVRGEVMAYKYNATNSPDHHTRFLINDRIDPIDDAYWDGKSRYRFEAQVPQSDLVEGTNQLKFLNINDAYAYPPFIAFDFFEVDYSRLFLADQNKLLFRGDNAGTYRYRAGGFTSSDINVYDVTDPVLPVRVINPSIISVGNIYSVTFLVTHGADERYLITGGVEAPENITYYHPPNFGSITTGVDYLFITHPDFITSTQNLASYRNSHGLTTMLVDVNDLYNEFNDGIFHPLAIKNFIAYAFAHWSSPPTYVLLIGDGSWDIKNNNPVRYGDAPTYMPPNFNWVDPWIAETDSPNLLTTVVGDDILPDVLIGRLPVSSSMELDNIISKIISYEQSPRATWQRNLLFIADDTPDVAGDFVLQSEAIINEYVRPGFDALRIYLDDYKDNNRCGAQPFPYGPTCTPVNRAITETVSITGTGFVNYAGHGDEQFWTSDKIVVYQKENPGVPNDYALNDIASMKNGGMLPVVVSMTCLDGYWFHPELAEQPSLSEVWLRTSGRGAIALFSSDGLGVESGHLTLQEGFYQAIFDDGIWNLGLATLAAKLHLYGHGTSLDLINTYITFGDPALHILSPYQVGLSPEAREGTASPGGSVTYMFQVTNQGSITDTISLSISNNNWSVEFPPTIGPLPAGESQSFEVTVNVPSDADGDATDAATFIATSLGDRSRTDSGTLITHSQPFYGVQVDPSSASQYDQPGRSVIYNLQVSNTGNITDSYDIYLSGFNWQVVAPSSIGPAARDESLVLPITVNIPIDVEEGDSDSVIVHVFSHADSSHSASAQLTTVTRTYGVSFTPPTTSKEGYQGTTITYSLQVDNIGGYMDTFTVTIDSEWPARAIPDLVGPVNPGQSASLNVAVDIPIGLPGGSFDEAIVTATSWGDPNQTGQALLRTIGNIPGLLVRPAYAAQVALPGSTVTYTLQITNTSNVIDTYNITVGIHNWPVTLSDGMIGPLDANGGSATLTAIVEIPPSAQEWSADTVVITVSSQVVPARIAIATLDTTARLYGVTVTPSEMADDGFPGTRVVYPLTITNTGGFPDTFTVTAVGGWPLDVSSTLVGPLEANIAEKITVNVDIPANAVDAIDFTNVVVTSCGNPEVSDQSILATTSRLYGVVLDPNSQFFIGSPGEDVVYELQVTNNSNYSDTFIVQINNSWITLAEPVWIGPLPPHTSTTLQVTVSIPLDAVLGSNSLATVEVTSLTDDRKNAVAYLTTYVEWVGLYLPLVKK